MNSLDELDAMSRGRVDLSRCHGLGIFTSNCDCGDSDGCDGDCGGDGSEGC